MFWFVLLLGILITKAGISSMLRYNRVKKESSLVSLIHRSDYPNSITKIKSPINRWLRKFLWLASTDGTKQHGIFAVLMFYLGLSLCVFAVILYPENAGVLFGNAT